MTRRSGRLPTLITGALLSALPLTVHAQAHIEDAAKDADYACAVPAPDAIAARATELGAADWDKNKLGCAADLWFALAGVAIDDPTVQVQALLATTAYMDHVNGLANGDLYAIHQGEWQTRLKRAAEHGKLLEARLAAVPAEDPTLLAARAIYRLTWPLKIADTKTQLAETRDAFGLLGKAVALDPKALEGNALWILGRLYYDLPEFAGGDPVKGLKLLEDAHRNTPGNPSILRYSAYVYAQERDLPRSKERLHELLRLPAKQASLQLMADELKGGADLAVRIGDAPLAGQLGKKRDALLAAHPDLLKRLPESANMHGGVDPITGKEY